MPKAVSAPGFRQTTSGAHGNAGRTDRLPRGKPPVYTDVRRFCRKQSPAGGMTCRLRRGVGFVVPWALSSEGEPKGCRGRAESPLQAALHDNSAGSSFLSGSMTCRLRRGCMAAVILWGGFAHLRGTKISKGRAESPLVRSQTQAFCRRGLTRRLRRGSRACSPMGRSHFSFDGERKVCKRKPAARRLWEKGSYCPF